MTNMGEGSLRPRQGTRARRSVRRITAALLLLLALSAPAGWVLGQETSEGYIVVLDQGAVGTSEVPVAGILVQDPFVDTNENTRTRIDARRVELQVEHLERRNRVRAESVFSSAVGGFSARLTRSQVRALAEDPSVAAIVVDEQFELDEITARKSGRIRTTMKASPQVPAGIRRVGAQRSRVARVDGRDTRVNADIAILDTGIDRRHPDLNVVGGYNCTSRNRDRWDDTNGHGTHVAGIAAALDNRIGVVGVAPGARLWSVKVLDGAGKGFLSWLVCGVDWVTAQRDGRSSRPLIEVANMSLSFGLRGGNDRDCGVPGRDALHQAICRSVRAGTVYVAAAGNNSRNARLNRPAAYDEVITVSAMADYDGRGGGRGSSKACPYWSPEGDDTFANFSAYGADVDLIAPGKCVLSTYVNSRYGWMSGTSMATPHVAGAAALYRSIHPGARPEQVRAALQAVGTRDWRTGSDPDDEHEKALWVGSFRAVPDFTFTVSQPADGIAPGTQVSLSVSIKRVGGLDGPVTFELDNPPAGISAAKVTTRGNNARLTITVGRSARTGRHVLNVAGRSAGLDSSQPVAIRVTSVASKVQIDSPDADATQSTTAVTVSWTETGARITGRRVERQRGRIRTAGTCEGVRYVTDKVRSASSAGFTDRAPTGYCYRWHLALTDEAGRRVSATSGSVLVDATPPRAPSVSLEPVKASANGLRALGVEPRHLDAQRNMWLRGGSGGSIDLHLDGSDPESSIAAYTARLSRAGGWRFSWVGGSRSGVLRVSYTSTASDTTLTVQALNGAGLSGPSTAVQLRRDSRAPAAGEWTHAPTAAETRTSSSTQVLRWSAGSDTGSGVADEHWVRRFRAPLTASGDCRTKAFVADGPQALAASGSTDRGLRPGYCYVWRLRTLDRVGNAAPERDSGIVIVEGRRR